MKTESEIRDLLARIYRELGKDPVELVRVAPLYGGWYNSLKYEVVRADDARTHIWRKDIEDTNQEAIAAALKAFAPPKKR